MKSVPSHNKPGADTTKVGAVTREMVHARARAIALLAGRSPIDVQQSDYDQARQEVTGESDPKRQEAALEALPATKRKRRISGQVQPSAKKKKPP